MAATTIVHSVGVNLTTDALFRAWGSPISAAIATAGWTQTADTGQVNWTTVTVPTAGTTPAAIYEVWRLADALQATDPVFLKIMYGRSASSGPYLRVIAGTASDGAGTITSAANTNVSVTATTDVFDGNNTLGSAVACKSYVNGDGSSLVLLLSPNQSSAPLIGGLMVLERRRAPDGTAAAGGFILAVMPGSQGVTAPKFQTVFTNNLYAQPNPSTAKGYALTGRQAASSLDSAVRSNVVPLYPVVTGAYPELGCPSKYMLAAYRFDVPLGQTVQATHYGATQTFMSVGGLWLGVSSVFWDLAGLDRVIPLIRID